MPQAVTNMVCRFEETATVGNLVERKLQETMNPSDLRLERVHTVFPITPKWLMKILTNTPKTLRVWILALHSTIHILFI